MRDGQTFARTPLGYVWTLTLTVRPCFVEWALTEASGFYGTSELLDYEEDGRVGKVSLPRASR